MISFAVRAARVLATLANGIALLGGVAGVGSGLVTVLGPRLLSAGVRGLSSRVGARVPAAQILVDVH